MFTRMGYAEIYREELLREFNRCHTPAGSPSGGQFCSAADGGGGGGPTIYDRKTRRIQTDVLRRARSAARNERVRTQAGGGGGGETLAARAARTGRSESELRREDERHAAEDVRARMAATRATLPVTPGPSAGVTNPYDTGEQAQRSPSFKGTKLGLQLASAVTDYDRRQEKRRSRSYYNPYALPQYLGAATRVQDAVAKGTPLEQALTDNFEGRLLDHVRKYLVKHPV